MKFKLWANNNADILSYSISKLNAQWEDIGYTFLREIEIPVNGGSTMRAIEATEDRLRAEKKASLLRQLAALDGEELAA